MKKVEIADVSFAVVEYDAVLSLFERWVKGEDPKQVCAVTVHSLLTSRNDPGLNNIFGGADLVTIDGEPIRWFANVVYNAGVRKRVCGPELMLRCVEHGLKKGWKHFFLGSTDKTLENLVRRLSQRYGGLRVVGKYSPPFRPLTGEEDRALVEKINSAKPDFLWVGLGAPKQEKWIHEHLDTVHVPVQIGVGAAFDFHSGNIPRAPKAWQKLGLEWLYRAFQDKRLWKRYLVTNPVFLYLFIRDFIKVRLFKIGSKDRHRTAC